MFAVAPESHQFKSGLSPIAIFSFRATEAERRFGIQFTKYWDDGLGEALGRIISVDSGRHFMLKELLNAGTPALFAEADDHDRTTDGLMDLLSGLGIRREECIWTIDDPLLKNPAWREFKE